MSKTSLPGSTESYDIHPECKKYTLRDNGFSESKTGKFQLIRPLSFGSQSNKEIQLKMVVSKDFKQLKMYTTTTSLHPVNLYKDDVFSKERENAEDILYELSENKVIRKTE